MGWAERRVQVGTKLGMCFQEVGIIIWDRRVTVGGCGIDLELMGGLSGKHAMTVERHDLSIGMIQRREEVQALAGPMLIQWMR